MEGEVTSYYETLEILRQAIRDNWSEADVDMPNLQIKNLDAMVSGHGTLNNEDIFVYAVEENVTPYGFGGRNYWHRMQATVDVSTNRSRERFNVLSRVIWETLKRSVHLSGQTQMLITGVHNLSGYEYWRGVWDVVLERQSL